MVGTSLGPSMRIDARQFSFEDQRWFAKVSGDANPIHVDRQNAESTFFGQLVVHGAHLVFWALDSLGKKCPDWLGQDQVRTLDVTFPKPVFLNENVDLVVVPSLRDEITVDVVKNRELLCRIALGREEQSRDSNNEAWWSDLVPSAISDEPRAVDVSKSTGVAGALKMLSSRADIKIRYPNLERIIEIETAEGIAALSALVGMETPGLNSLFGGFKLSMGRLDTDPHLFYKIVKTDARFSKVEMKVHTPYFAGSVSAFHTPKSCAQSSYGEVLTKVSPGMFAGMDALVIGGSKGLGEVTAKILAAGGASVHLTYARSKHSAERVASEIREGGGTARFSEADILDKASIEQLVGATDSPPTHVFYFATPKIFTRKTALFEYERFREFCA